MLDLSVIAFILPYLAAAAYGVYAWLREGFQPLYPSGAFLEVTKNPLLFLLGSISNFVGLALFVRGFELSERRKALRSASQILVFSGLLSVFSAYFVALWSTGGFSEAAGLMVEGRFSSTYPCLLFSMAFLLKVELPKDALKKIRGGISPIILLIVIPTYYYLTKPYVGGLSLINFILGLLILVVLTIIVEKFIVRG